MHPTTTLEFADAIQAKLVGSVRSLPRLERFTRTTNTGYLRGAFTEPFSSRRERGLSHEFLHPLRRRGVARRLRLPAAPAQKVVPQPMGTPPDVVNDARRCLSVFNVQSDRQDLLAHGTMWRVSIVAPNSATTRSALGALVGVIMFVIRASIAVACIRASTR
ncbi:hypothetical protein BD310DRAFT_717863 [Dichomitus squalens]|uniref:Uncharacterized protein n=1 Tax=Dichomitus squalens TaxID=114155 RepID=A0A4Q9PLB4_9APHY|nr:hypothetical protein BD310DRAFT_717863 [Dichomitus squalens]